MRIFEKETSIFYNEEDETANVYTYNRGLISRLDKLCKSRPDECKIHKIINDTVEDLQSKEYQVPKSWVTVRPPKQMNYNYEELQARAERMRSLHDKDTGHVVEGK